jgi:hypothetical protein
VNEVFVGFIFLGAAVLFVGLLIAGRFGALSPGLRITRWTCGALALLSGGYIWLFLHSLTIVSVVSNCPSYIGVVSAGERHNVLFRFDQTDYFALLDPREGSVDVHGRNGVIVSEGYVTSIMISTVDFSLDENCRAVSSQKVW